MSHSKEKARFRIGLPLLRNSFGVSRWYSYQNSKGQGLAEYLIIVVLIAIIVIVGIRYFGSGVKGQFENATEEVAGAREGSSPNVAKPNSVTPSAARGSGTRGDDTGGRALTSAGESASNGSPSKANAGGADSGSETDDELSEQLSELKAAEVGEVEVSAVSKIEISWGFLLTMGAVLVLLAVAYLFKEMKDKEGGSGSGGGD